MERREREREKERKKKKEISRNYAQDIIYNFHNLPDR